MSADQRSTLAKFNAVFNDMGFGKSDADPNLKELAKGLRAHERGCKVTVVIHEPSSQRGTTLNPEALLGALQPTMPLRRARDVEEWKLLSIAAEECGYSPEHLRRLCVKHYALPPSKRGFQCKRDGKPWLVELNSLQKFSKRKHRKRR